MVFQLSHEAPMNWFATSGLSARSGLMCSGVSAAAAENAHSRGQESPGVLGQRTREHK
jgi:hypothetical protein